MIKRREEKQNKKDEGGSQSRKWRDVIRDQEFCLSWRPFCVVSSGQPFHPVCQWLDGKHAKWDKVTGKLHKVAASYMLGSILIM